MSTRYYLQNAAAPYSPATVRGTWDTSAGMVGKKIATTKSGTLAAMSQQTTSNANYKRAIVRYVSDGLPADATVTFSDYCIGYLESDAGANCYTRIYAYMTQGDSDNVRGVLVNDWQGSAEWSAVSTNGVAGSPTNSPVSALAGDRIVVIFGFLANSTSATYTGQAYCGLTNATDLTTSTAFTTYPGWLNFTLAAAGTNTPKSLACSAAGSVALGRKAGKHVAASGRASVAAPVRKVGKHATASANVAATVVRMTGKHESAAALGSSTTARRTGKGLAASATVSATLSRATHRILAASASVASVLEAAWSAGAHAWEKALTSVASASTTLVRATSTHATASASAAATVSKRAGKRVTGTANATAAVSKRTGKHIAAGASFASILAAVLNVAVHAYYKALSATASAASTLARMTSRGLTASAQGSSTVARRTDKHTVASARATTTLSRRVGKAFAAFGRAAASLVGRHPRRDRAVLTSHLDTTHRSSHTTTRDLLDATLRTIRLITRR